MSDSTPCRAAGKPPMAGAGVAVAHRDGVAVVTLCRPQARNALDAAALEALRDAFLALADCAETRVVRLCGEGPAFCAGGDVDFFASLLEGSVAVRREALHDYLGLAHEAILALDALPWPLIAEARGAAAGFGLSLLCAADRVIAAETLRLVPAYAALGVGPDGGLSHRLPALIGERRALNWLLEGDPITAARAADWGLVDEVVPETALEASGEAVARRLARGASLALRQTKRLVRGRGREALAEHLEAERRAFIEAASTPDFAEGIRAFLAKRAPRFSGPDQLTQTSEGGAL